MSQHLEEQGLDFLQFAFRWVNCLLIREVPFCLAPRLWDTYLAEGTRFPDYLVRGAGGAAGGAGWWLVVADGLCCSDQQRACQLQTLLTTH